jgi:hypothetical protein
MERVKIFLRECLSEKSGSMAIKSHVRTSYEKFCERNGAEYKPTTVDFVIREVYPRVKHGRTPRILGGEPCFVGVKLRA